MGHLDFSYGSADVSGSSITVDIFHDCALTRAQLAQDVVKSGHVCAQQEGSLALLDAGRLDQAPLADAVVLDCTRLDAQRTAQLAKLDMRLARSASQLIVLASLDTLDTVFAVFDQSGPQFLIEASRTEMLLAIGRVAVSGGGSALHEMSEDERISLARLSQQVDAIAHRLDGREIEHKSAQGRLREQSLTWLSSNSDAYRCAQRGADHVPLPDPRRVRQIIRQRQARAQFFDASLFGEPAWDMLLDLTAAKAERKLVSVTSLCIASGVPATTALRWVKQMVKMGLFERTDDNSDKRRAFIGLSEKASDAMACYFAKFSPEELAG